MRRRKYLGVVGLLAASLTAVTGTNAFTDMTANRQVGVEVVEDADAYLGLARTGSDSSGAFVDVSDGTVSFDFSSSNGDVSGDGFNPNSVTVIDSLLQVTNQGTQSVEFHADFTDVDLTDENAGQAYVALQPVKLDSGSRDEELNQNVAKNAGATNISGEHSGFDTYDFGSQIINQGHAIELDMVVDTREFTPASSASFPLADDGTIAFVADQSES